MFQQHFKKLPTTTKKKKKNGIICQIGRSTKLNTIFNIQPITITNFIKMVKVENKLLILAIIHFTENIFDTFIQMD